MSWFSCKKWADPVCNTWIFISSLCMTCFHLQHVTDSEHCCVFVSSAFWLLFRKIVNNFIIKFKFAIFCKTSYCHRNKTFGNWKHAVKRIFIIWCIISFSTYFSMTHNNCTVKRKLLLLKPCQKIFNSIRRYAGAFRWSCFKNHKILLVLRSKMRLPMQEQRI